VGILACRDGIPAGIAPAFLPACSDRQLEASVESALRPHECGRGSLKGHATN
jgi:hypothetical protein